MEYVSQDEHFEAIYRLESEIEKYRAALADLPCAYSHNEHHDRCCRCADCTQMTENCDCVRCVAIWDYGPMPKRRKSRRSP